MDVEIRLDRVARRRHRRGMLLSVLAFALYLPAVILVLSLMGAVLGREAAGPYAGAQFLVGLAALMAAPLHGTWDWHSYRCPRCGRRASRVIARGVSEPHIHYHCAGCRVIWDLGWGWGEKA